MRYTTEERKAGSLFKMYVGGKKVQATDSCRWTPFQHPIGELCHTFSPWLPKTWQPTSQRFWQTYKREPLRHSKGPRIRGRSTPTTVLFRTCVEAPTSVTLSWLHASKTRKKTVREKKNEKLHGSQQSWKNSKIAHNIKTIVFIEMYYV